MNYVIVNLKKNFLTQIVILFFLTSVCYSSELIRINFNSGHDSENKSEGDLIFYGTDGFKVIFSDDNSDGEYGGDANGVHITNKDTGNIKLGLTDDFVLGALNTNYSADENFHSSGIVADFNCGVELVKFLDTDDDTTVKTLYAFDKEGNLIGNTQAASQITFQIDTSMTEGKLIYKIEFDTSAGTDGGSHHQTYFTIDDFVVEGDLSNATQSLIDINFNSGFDTNGVSQGNLIFRGNFDLEVSCTDDDSDGSFGGNAEGVHITNKNHGNIKAGTSDLVLGAFNDPFDSTMNYHSSGIVCKFNYGVSLIKFMDTDDDTTTKTLYAFDKNDNVIGQTNAGTQKVFQIDTTMTNGQLIHKFEFDTSPGTDGGASQQTYFTIDDLHIEGQHYTTECNDTDQDGVPDQWDNCPSTNNNSWVNNMGCPAEGLYTEEQLNQIISHILTWGDLNGDKKIGLSEAIHALKVSSGVTEPEIKYNSQ